MTAADTLAVAAAADIADDTLAVQTVGLTKQFASIAVVDHLDLRVPTGSVFGFLGPNGSGKTTTIRMLLGLVNPSAGSVRLLGQAMPEAANRVLPSVGTLVEGPAFYPWLSGRRNLIRIDAAGPDPRRANRTERVDTALANVGLSAAADKRYRAYSLGMRQRLGLAAALLRPRKLLVLDEPTNGMDPQGTREIRNLIRSVAADGTTVLLCSHLLGEVEQVCTHAAIITSGQLVAQGPLESLREPSTTRVTVETDDTERAKAVFERLELRSIAVAGAFVSAALDGQRPEDCCKTLVLADVGVRSFTARRPSLEDTYVALTGEGFDVAR
jgi:ABC-2 type transport system ATP-binding protein